VIAVDWGTSSFRAYRLDDAGRELERRSAPAGLLACGGAFEATLAAQLQGWDDPLVLMAGMIGSRNGWREVPYVACPAGLDEVARGMVRVDAPALPGRRILIAPGVSWTPPDGAPEVMRGEETQLLGLMAQLPGDARCIVCLPGTHSKWVTIAQDRIATLRTAMTGELYALLRAKSLLSALMPPDSDADADDDDSFARGVADSAREGGLLNQLFGVRTRGLFGSLEAPLAPSFLSGLLIGHELRGLLPDGARHVHLVGGPALAQRYRRALDRLGVASTVHGESLTAAGLCRLARAAGLTA
jgi:2-dehydro-3-deoxygalactonokinase